MSKPLPIPEEEQLQALASGLRSLYALLRSYVGDLNQVPEWRKLVTIDRDRLAGYLSRHRELASKHVSSEKSLEKMHDMSALVERSGKWVVCWIDHGRIVEEQVYDRLEVAAANHLMSRI